MTMKTTYRVRHKKQAWSESNKESYRKLKWKNSSEDLGTECCNVNTQRNGRPNTSAPTVPNIGPLKAIGFFRPVGKWINYTAQITRSSPLMIQTIHKHIPRGSSAVALTQSSLLPPIKGSRMTPGEVESANTHESPIHPTPKDPKANFKARIAPTHLNKENTLFRRYLTRRNEQNTAKADLIRDSLTVRKIQNSLKNPIPRADACDSLLSPDEKLNAQQSLASNSAAQNLSAKRQKPDEGDPSANENRVTTNGAGRSEPKQTKELASEGSTVETESQCTEEKSDSEVTLGNIYTPDEEYYTNQRIAEWVLKVNASLFSPSNDSLRSISPGQEQDTAIKIVYDGD